MLFNRCEYKMKVKSRKIAVEQGSQLSLELEADDDDGTIGRLMHAIESLVLNDKGEPVYRGLSNTKGILNANVPTSEPVELQAMLQSVRTHKWMLKMVSRASDQKENDQTIGDYITYLYDIKPLCVGVDNHYCGCRPARSCSRRCMMYPLRRMSIC